MVGEPSTTPQRSRPTIATVNGPAPVRTPDVNGTALSSADRAPSERASTIAPFEVMDVIRSADQMDSDRQPGDPRVCHLEVGQPTGTAPSAVIDAARVALGSPLGYTDSLGTAALCNRISEHYAQRHGLTVGAERIAVTTGASAGVVLALLATLDIGDRLGVVQPGYPCYANVAKVLGIDVVSVAVHPDPPHQVTPESLDAAGDLDVLVVASPSNPTGTVLSEDELGAIRNHCLENSCQLMVDEIYHGTSAVMEATAAGFDEAIVIQSFSKYFCMTGWRIGWLVLPERLRRPVELLAQNLYLSPPTLAQAAAIAAFDATDELDRRAQLYATNRAVLSEALTDMGAQSIFPATGAFYVWADLSHLGTSAEVTRRMLSEIAVAATPGADFDPLNGERFVRFSVAGSADEIAEASRRIREWAT